jgi:biotin carboxylase
MLLLIESGSQTFREYILERAYASKISICLVKHKPITWEKSWITSSLLYSDLTCGKSNVYKGITTYVDTSLQQTAELAEELGLPFYSKELVSRCQDKYELRRMLEEKGLPNISSHLVTDVSTCLRAVNELGFPAVIKPVKGYGSISVFKVESIKDVFYYFESVAKSFTDTGEFVVENYLDGPELSAEVLVYAGEIIFMGLTDKLLSAEPYFEESGHVFPAYKHPDSHQPVRDFINILIKAFQIQQGVLHAEVRVTSQGPQLVELNLRLGGDFIPYLVRLATGVDFSTCGFELALGLKPNVKITEYQSACVRFFIPEYSGKIRGIKGLEYLDHPNVINSNLRTGLEGMIVELPPKGFLTRLGYFIVKASTSQEAERLADEIYKEVKINYEQ